MGSDVILARHLIAGWEVTLFRRVTATLLLVVTLGIYGFLIPVCYGSDQLDLVPDVPSTDQPFEDACCNFLLSNQNAVVSHSVFLTRDIPSMLWNLPGFISSVDPVPALSRASSHSPAPNHYLTSSATRTSPPLRL